MASTKINKKSILACMNRKFIKKWTKIMIVICMSLCKLTRTWLPRRDFWKLPWQSTCWERIGQVKTIVMEHFNGILFHKSGPANKQHTNHSLIHNNRFDINNIVTVFWALFTGQNDTQHFTTIALLRWNIEGVLQLCQGSFIVIKKYHKSKNFSVDFHCRCI